MGARQTRRRHPLVSHQAGPRRRPASVPGQGVPTASQLIEGVLSILACPTPLYNAPLQDAAATSNGLLSSVAV